MFAVIPIVKACAFGHSSGCACLPGEFASLGVIELLRTLPSVEAEPKVAGKISKDWSNKWRGSAFAAAGVVEKGTPLWARQLGGDFIGMFELIKCRHPARLIQVRKSGVFGDVGKT